MTTVDRVRHRRSAAVGVTCVVALSVGGCGSGSATTPAPTTAASSSTAVTPSASPSSSVFPAGRPTTCVDPTDDSLRSGDLTTVAITEGADAVRVAWTTTADVAALAAGPNSVLFGLDLTRPGADGPSLTFLVKGTDGAFLPAFATSGANGNVDALTPVTVDGTTVTATFPPDVLADLGSAWTFDAALDQQGNDVDRCRG